MVDGLTNRREILEEAITLINGDRNNHYGDPVDDFATTATMWQAYLERVSMARGHQFDIEPHDVAIMMCLVKISRIAQSPEKRDHWADLAGYAGCGYDCSVREHGDDPF